MKSRIESTKKLIVNNKKVIENYFFMTVLQVLNSLFYLIIYPFLIRVLGPDSYGLYVFALSFVGYFLCFIGFGFDMPALKLISQNSTNSEIKSHTLSCVFTSKIYLEIISLIIFSIIVIEVPMFHKNWLIFFLCFAQTIVNIIFPQWYFQGMQKMRIVTFIQLGFKLLSLPFIFYFVRSVHDVVIFTLISTIASLAGGGVAFLDILVIEKLKIKWIPFSDLKIWFKDAFPFFLSSSAGIIKEQSVTIIIGSFLGMREVAIYDLANKIIIVPRTLLVSINGALFPKIMANFRIDVVKKVINYQIAIGLFVVLCIAVFGKWIVHFMGGVAMNDSYPISVILSITILSWIVVGAFINFVFVPNNKYYYVSKNQLVAFISFFIYCSIGLFFRKDALVLAVALSLSGLTEILFCKYVVTKEKLLS